MLHDSTAALLLLSALPQSNDPAKDPVYNNMIDAYTSAHEVPDMSLATLKAAILKT